MNCHIEAYKDLIAISKYLTDTNYVGSDVDDVSRKFNVDAKLLGKLKDFCIGHAISIKVANINFFDLIGTVENFLRDCHGDDFDLDGQMSGIYNNIQDIIDKIFNEIDCHVKTQDDKQ